MNKSKWASPTSPAGGWETMWNSDESSQLSLAKLMTHRITNFVNGYCKLGSLGSRCWDRVGIQNTCERKREGSRVWLGVAVRAWCSWHVSIKEFQSKDCPLAESWTGLKWLDFSNTAFLCHWVGINLRWEWCLKAVSWLYFLSSSESSLWRRIWCGASPQYLKPPSFRGICYAAKASWVT